METLEETKDDFEELTDSEIEDLLFNKVYDYVSAEAWLDAAKDFLEEARKSKQKRIPQYSGNFISKVQQKIVSVESMIADSNISEASLSEAVRRLNAAKISYDNNFYFAALYDAYFSEAFIISEPERTTYDDNYIFDLVETELPEKKAQFDSVWASLFIDHAMFFFENAKFEQSLGRTSAMRSSLDTSFDLILLSGKIDDAKEEVDLYLAANTFPEYVGRPDLDTSIDISYTQKVDPLQLVTIVFVIALIVALSVVLFFGIKGNKSLERGPIKTRIAKVERVRDNLGVALTKNKITDAEYFFIKKRYDDELKALKNEQAERSRVVMGLDESKAKLKALIVGRKALQKHYKAGIIIEEDYKKHYVELTKEIITLKNEIDLYQSEIRGTKVRASRVSATQTKIRSPRVRRKSVSKAKTRVKVSKKSSAVKGTKEAEDNVKGTKEIAKDEAAEEKRELNKRKAALKKYRDKKKKKKKR